MSRMSFRVYQFNSTLTPVNDSMYMWPLDILDRGLFLPSSHPLKPALARRVLAVLRCLEAKQVNNVTLKD